MKKLFFFLFLAGCASIPPVEKDVTDDGIGKVIPPVVEVPGHKYEEKRDDITEPAFSNRAYKVGKNSVIGKVRYYKVRDSESLIEIARMFNLGYNGITEANPGADPFVPPNGMVVQVPTEWVLPDVREREGIVINIAELRLYFFPRRNSGKVYTFPIGIGDEGTETPTGSFKIIQKKVNPAWKVPKSIKKEDPKLPDVVPPGPDNPLGTHAMRLSASSILIHGTNRPWGIGRRVSHDSEYWLHCIHSVGN